LPFFQIVFDVDADAMQRIRMQSKFPENWKQIKQAVEALNVCHFLACAGARVDVVRFPRVVDRSSFAIVMHMRMPCNFNQTSCNINMLMIVKFNFIIGAEERFISMDRKTLKNAATAVISQLTDDRVLAFTRKDPFNMHNDTGIEYARGILTSFLTGRVQRRLEKMDGNASLFDDADLAFEALLEMQAFEAEITAKAGIPAAQQINVQGDFHAYGVSSRAISNFQDYIICLQVICSGVGSSAEVQAPHMKPPNRKGGRPKGSNDQWKQKGISKVNCSCTWCNLI